MDEASEGAVRGHPLRRAMLGQGLQGHDVKAAYEKALAAARRAKRLEVWATAPLVAGYLALPCLAVLFVVLAWDHRIVVSWIGAPDFALNGFLRGVCGVTAVVFALATLAVVAAFRSEPTWEADRHLLGRDDVPALFATLDRMTRAANTRPIDAVSILPECQAFAMEEPGEGGRRVLGLGLPLLMLLSPQRALAVIAHEIGHFAHEDNAASRWTHKVVDAQERVETVDGALGHLSVLATPLVIALSVLAAVLEAVSARSSRRAEIAADAFAALAVDRGAAAEALVLLHVLGDEAETAAWTPVLDAFEAGHELPLDLVGTMPLRMLEIYNRSRMKALLHERSRDETALDDTHPALAERVRALGERLVLPAIDPEARAFEHLLGAAAPKVGAHVEAAWRERVGEQFRDRHADVARTRELMPEAVAAMDTAADPAEAGEIVALLAERGLPWAEAKPLLEDLCELFADGPDTNMDTGARVPIVTGQALLLSERLVRGDVDAIEPAIAVLHDAPALATALYEPLWELLHWEPGDGNTLQARFLAERPDVARQLDVAVTRFEMRDPRHSGPRLAHDRDPLVPHGLAPWHVAMIVEELQRWCRNRSIELRAARLKRHAGDDGGAPFFSLIVDGSKRIPAHEQGALAERLCLPGGFNWMYRAPGEDGFSTLEMTMEGLRAPDAVIHERQAASIDAEAEAGVRLAA